MKSFAIDCNVYRQFQFPGKGKSIFDVNLQVQRKYSTCRFLLNKSEPLKCKKPLFSGFCNLAYYFYFWRRGWDSNPR